MALEYLARDTIKSRIAFQITPSSLAYFAKRRGETRLRDGRLAFPGFFSKRSTLVAKSSGFAWITGKKNVISLVHGDTRVCRGLMRISLIIFQVITRTAEFSVRLTRESLGR